MLSVYFRRLIDILSIVAVLLIFSVVVGTRYSIAQDSFATVPYGMQLLPLLYPDHNGAPRRLTEEEQAANALLIKPASSVLITELAEQRFIARLVEDSPELKEVAIAVVQNEDVSRDYEKLLASHGLDPENVAHSFAALALLTFNLKRSSEADFSAINEQEIAAVREQFTHLYIRFSPPETQAEELSYQLAMNRLEFILQKRLLEFSRQNVQLSAVEQPLIARHLVERLEKIMGVRLDGMQLSPRYGISDQ